MAQIIEARQFLDPSNLFVGGEFAARVKNFPIERTPVPEILVTDPSNHQLEIISRPDIFGFYTGFTNEIIDTSPLIPPPFVRINPVARTGKMINETRSHRTQSEIDPLRPGNEYATSPFFSVIVPRQDSTTGTDAIDIEKSWRVRTSLNLYSYLVPRKEILVSDRNIHEEIACGMSFVCAVNSNEERLPLHDPLLTNQETVGLMLLAFTEASRLIKTHGVYIDKTDNKTKPFGVVLGFMNYGPSSGRSLEWPHFQIAAYPRENTDPFIIGSSPNERGLCDRCEGVIEKTDTVAKERVVAETSDTMAYIPDTEAVPKGDVIRITTKKHYSNFQEIIEQDPETLKQLASIVHNVMYKFALDQQANSIKDPSVNITFHQDIDASPTSHLYIELSTGDRSGGFSKIMPVYKINDSYIKPGLSYEGSDKVAARYRSIGSLYQLDNGQ